MFTQKISMDCTKEQYEKYLKEELEKMGYGASLARWGDAVIVNNLSSENGLVGNPSRISNKFDNSRTYLGKFNAPLFLALAAMREGLYLGYGQYVTSETDCTLHRNHWGGQYFNGKDYHISTVSEIMAKFREPKVESITIAVDITNHSDEEQTFVATEKQMISFLRSRGYNVSIVNDSPALENILAEKNMITRLKSKGYRIFKQTTTLEEV